MVVEKQVTWKVPLVCHGTHLIYDVISLCLLHSFVSFSSIYTQWNVTNPTLPTIFLNSIFTLYFSHFTTICIVHTHLSVVYSGDWITWTITWYTKFWFLTLLNLKAERKTTYTMSVTSLILPLSSCLSLVYLFLGPVHKTRSPQRSEIISGLPASHSAGPLLPVHLVKKINVTLDLYTNCSCDRSFLTTLGNA